MLLILSPTNLPQLYQFDKRDNIHNFHLVFYYFIVSFQYYNYYLLINQKKLSLIIGLNQYLFFKAIIRLLFLYFQYLYLISIFLRLINFKIFYLIIAIIKFKFFICFIFPNFHQVKFYYFIIQLNLLSPF